jgi:hypothetical protein
MARAHTFVEAVVEAPARDVYSVLADYTHHHPHIMPAMFSGLEVESGGVGAGTVFHITLRIAGKDKRLHMRVDEPEPGRVLTETDLDSGSVTTFSLSRAGGDDPTVRIGSEWELRTGIGGVLDRVALPPMTRSLLRKQLAQLALYMRTQPVGPH